MAADFPDYLLVHEVDADRLQDRINTLIEAQPGYELLGAPFSLPQANAGRGVAQALIKGAARSADREIVT